LGAREVVCCILGAPTRCVVAVETSFAQPG
jgi:hypothetical protein